MFASVLFTLAFEVCTMLRAVMAVRQRVSTVLEDEALIVERTEAQFRHFNSVEDVIGGLERVKFCHGIHFCPFQNCHKVSMVDVLFYNVFLYTLGFFSAISFHSPKSTFSPSTRRTLWVRDNPFPT